MNFCNLSGKDLNKRSHLVSYIYGVVCAMNRYYKSGISQAIYEMYNVEAAKTYWTHEQIFWFLSDIQLLLEVDKMSAYRKVIYDITQHMAVYKADFKDNE